MKLGNINITEGFLKFWNNPDRNRTILGWAGLMILYVIPMVIMMVSSIMIDVVEAEGFIILFVCTYIIMIIMGIFLGVFLPGATIYQLAAYIKGEDTISVFSNLWVKLKLGIKYILVTLFYSFPAIIIFFVSIGLFIWGIISMENSGDDIPANFIVGILGYIFGILIMMAWQFLWKFLFAPVVMKKISEYNFRQCFSIKVLWKEFLAYKNDILYLGLAMFLIDMIWSMLYFLSYILVYVLIGVLLLPLSFVLFYIIHVYVKPQLMSQIFNKKK